MGSTPCLLYTILCVVFEARVINLCDHNIATMSLYMDDLIFTGNDEDMFKNFKESMKKKFDMSDLCRT